LITLGVQQASLPANNEIAGSDQCVGDRFIVTDDLLVVHGVT
jgi:hypothetical protein